MTSLSDALKTNEYLRRRKLRIQQVREQSKEIAKKIRQRAKVEKQRHIGELDEKKQQEYFRHQEKLVHKLEQYYAKGIRSVGSGHKNASEVNLQTPPEEKPPVDLSKKRGREAAAELKRKKQERLDERQKSLDRKLQAREIANEISRDRSGAIIQKLSTKVASNIISANAKEHDTEKVNAVTCDMATQWDFDELPDEWEPRVPTLALPKDDSDKNSKGSPVKQAESTLDRSKRQNLFALSEDMPTSLTGGIQRVTGESVSVKPSLTLVSEYLQNRGLRLRDNSTAPVVNSNDDLQSIKQTILKTRASRTEGNACHVADIQVVPVPSWQPTNCEFCTKNVSSNTANTSVQQFIPVTNSQINKFSSSVRSMKQSLHTPTPVLRGSSPFRRTKSPYKLFNETARKEKPTEADDKKKPVRLYNHSTRDVKDIPHESKRVVSHDTQLDEDAYSQAARESIMEDMRDREHQNKLQEMRSKLAMTKHNVEKEYKDTMAFLTSLPKDKSKPIRTAYMDEDRQQLQKDNRQRKLQHEYKQIEKDCRRHGRRISTGSNQKHIRHKSPAKPVENNFDFVDSQYSWMPVPDDDGNLIVHTIPTTVKENKGGNSVKFSKIDSYHEYRSRHKHTPPTKETVMPENKQTKRVKTVLIDDNDNDSSDSSTTDSDTSSVENLNITKQHTHSDREQKLKLSDAEKVVIYKILNAKNDKKSKEKLNSKLIKKMMKSLNSAEKDKVLKSLHETEMKGKQKVRQNASTTVSFEQLNEGLYKAVNNEGDNIAKLYFNDALENEPDDGRREDTASKIQACACGKTVSVQANTQYDEQQPGTSKQILHETSKLCSCRANTAKATQSEKEKSGGQASETVSAESFKSAATDKKLLVGERFVKMLDQTSDEAGKFYIGATGFLQENGYEVVIQLRKNKEDRKDTEVQTPQKSNASKEINTEESSRVTVDVKLDTNSDNILNEEDDRQQPRQSTIVNIGETGEMEGHKTHVSDKSLRTSDDFKYTKKGSSAYTQTTFESPEHRPVYQHQMSSSTSTSYMSPPEHIMPQFLKNDRVFACYNVKDPTPSKCKDGVEIIGEQGICQKFVDCKCSRCNHERELALRQNAIASNIAKTPPNSANTDSTSSFQTAYTPENKVEKKKKCHKHHNHKSKQKLVNKHTSRSSVMRGTSRRKILNRNINKFTLSPIIKCYVDKLLALNKEGIKAVEVMNQECSSVATPGSSIIDEPGNVSKTKVPIDNKISLQQIQQMIKNEILSQIASQTADNNGMAGDIRSNALRKRKSVHKVKSLNISKNIMKVKNDRSSPLVFNREDGSRTSIQKIMKVGSETPHLIVPNNSEEGSRISAGDLSTKRSSNTNAKISSKSPARKDKEVHRNADNTDSKSRTTIPVVDRPVHKNNSKASSCFSGGRLKSRSTEVGDTSVEHSVYSSEPDERRCTMSRKSGVSSCESEFNILSNKKRPSYRSTQAKNPDDDELKYMKLAEDKIQNMEKIADLTEKCTKRLSNLAKVLEEVRRNKLTYSQVSDSASESERASSGNNVLRLKPPAPFETIVDMENEIKYMNEAQDTTLKIPASRLPTDKENKKETSPRLDRNIGIVLTGHSDTSSESENILKSRKLNKIYEKGSPGQSDNNPTSEQSDPFLVTPGICNVPRATNEEVLSKNKSPPPPVIEDLTTSDSTEYVSFLKDIPKPEVSKSQSQLSQSSQTDVTDKTSSKLRSKPRPPPALARINLRHEDEVIIPHELSTVMEVESPMSVRVKNKSTSNINTSNPAQSATKDSLTNLNVNRSTSQITQQRKPKTSSTDSSEDSKMQMMDLKRFNEIMLKPFISFQDYAKQCNVVLDESSTLEEVPKEDVQTDMSSLPSDASLPDVIAELLKRNLINSPFKFDTTSNGNSTTVSSESTISMLALSKTRKAKKKSTVSIQNKENLAETSDSLSISSNPDLENAFKNLGMGWASSTLKKTKERLALSSSSNTSSSSLSQFKMKTFKNKDDAPVVSDAVPPPLRKLSHKSTECKKINNSRNVEQQTSQMHSMTVKEFLTKELAGKITFNKSQRDDLTEEFISLYETKMPEEMKHDSRVAYEERSADSGRSGSNNRARTSTPVQIFRSKTYHSSSSSNVSNGLFSNADDLSSVKGTSNSQKNQSTSEKDDLTIPNCSLRMKKNTSDCSKSD